MKCIDPSVTYQVVGRIENVSRSRAQFNDDIRGRKADTVFWEGAEGGGYKPGTVLCLAARK